MSAPTTLLDFVIQAAIRVGLAILVWLIGRLVISIVLKMTRRALEARKLDSTATRYIITGLSLLLKVLLVLMVLGVFGIETTIFAALFAAVGVAIGMAVSGLVEPAPSASISEFKAAGPVVTLAVYCSNDDYWQVFYDGNRMISEAFTEAAFPAPMEALQVLSSA
jgi:small-conductance mechanosensitive channel